MNLLIESSKNQFLGFFFLVPNLLFFCYLLYVHYSFSFLFLLLFLLLSFFFSFLFFFSFTFAILTFPTSVSTSFHTSPDISLFLLLLFFSQFQSYSKQTMIFLKLHYTSNHQSYQSLFSPYVSGNKYLPPLYTQ